STTRDWADLSACFGIHADRPEGECPDYVVYGGNMAVRAGAIDPGFGFGKTTAHNYRLLAELPRLLALGAPVLVGVSRKRMINEVLGTRPEEALNGTTALHAIALLKGASVLRAHDAREAVQCVRLIDALRTAAQK
ncbi:MAG: dihydropteroate synthase, partial [Flavobacteriales bacterium]